MPTHASVASQPASYNDTISAWLLRIVDFCLLAVIFIAPLFMGGRGPLGKFVFLCFACAAATAWCAREALQAKPRWRWSGVEWLLLAGFLLVLTQLLPLPEWLLLKLSPSLDDRLPLFLSDTETPARFSQWNTVSLTPVATRGALIVYCAYLMLFFTVVQRIKGLTDVQRLLRWIAFGGVFLAGLGLVQFLFSNGKFLWVYQHPSREPGNSVMGPFQNQNHLAHCLALAIGPLIWCVWSQTRMPSNRAAFASPSKINRSFAGLRNGKILSVDLVQHAFAVGLGLVSIACLLTFSRGGITAAASAGAACIGVYYWKRLVGKKSLGAAGAAMVVALAALMIHGYEPLARRLATLRDSRSLEEVSAGRHALWSALLEGIREFAILGSGIGSQRQVYPIFMEQHFNVQFTHGESGYLPLLLEAGVPGLLLLLAGIAISAVWCFKTLLRRPTPPEAADRSSDRGAKELRSAEVWACAGAILPGLVASVVHSVGDFVWYLSACMSITVLLLACACRLYQLSVAGEEKTTGEAMQGLPAVLEKISAFLVPRRSVVVPMSRLTVCVGAALVGGVSFMMAQERLPAALASPHWSQYRCIAPSGALPLRQDRAEVAEILFESSRHLERALVHDPADPVANMRMAAVRLQQFDVEQHGSRNPMSLANIREAALASNFGSREAQEAWLERAVGENRELLYQALRHCRTALRTCPLLGEGYIYLADLSFLEGPQPAAKEVYLGQAQKVRPHSGIVHFALGREASLGGDPKKTIHHWKKAFEQDPDVQALLIDRFAGQLPARFFLEHLDPDLHALGRLYSRFHQLGQNEETHEIGIRYVEALKAAAMEEQTQAASDHWYQAHVVYRFLRDQQRALACARKAVELTPNAFAKRRALAALLIENQQYEEAVEQFQWCVRRAPDDPSLTQQLARATKLLVERQSASRAASSDLLR